MTFNVIVGKYVRFKSRKKYQFLCFIEKIVIKIANSLFSSKVFVPSDYKTVGLYGSSTYTHGSDNIVIMFGQTGCV